MSHSIIVSNVPIDVSDVSVMRYIREMTGDTPVVHMQPFPDHIHYVNDENGTKTVQIFFGTAEEAALVNTLFQGSNVEGDLARVHALFHEQQTPQAPEFAIPAPRSRIKSLSA